MSVFLNSRFPATENSLYKPLDNYIIGRILILIFGLSYFESFRSSLQSHPLVGNPVCKRIQFYFSYFCVNQNFKIIGFNWNFDIVMELKKWVYPPKLVSLKNIFLITQPRNTIDRLIFIYLSLKYIILHRYIF